MATMRNILVKMPLNELLKKYSSSELKVKLEVSFSTILYSYVVLFSYTDPI
jgi:hypothetical protein